jgi:hypothetical protein
LSAATCADADETEATTIEMAMSRRMDGLLNECRPLEWTDKH